jgi:hypothetical protein
MSHNNDVMDWIKFVSSSKIEESILDDGDNVGGLNYTFCLVTPLALLIGHIFNYKIMCHLHNKP